MAEMR
jgi:hypothetical protein